MRGINFNYTRIVLDTFKVEVVFLEFCNRATIFLYASVMPFKSHDISKDGVIGLSLDRYQPIQ